MSPCALFLGLVCAVAGCSTSSASTDGSLPNCMPSEPAPVGPPGAAALGYTYSALPSGACGSQGSCILPVFGPCNNDPEYVGYPLNSYECSCVSQKWACFLMVQGGSVCQADDAGADIDSTGPADVLDGDLISADSEKSDAVTAADAFLDGPSSDSH
jgi:hypothetical protein